MEKRMKASRNDVDTDKRVSLQEAAAMVPEQGCCLALGGLTLYRRPMAFVMALLARFLACGRPSQLSLLCFTAAVESDILIGAGMVSQIRTCYCGLEAFGLAPHFTSAASSGKLQIIEETEASIAFGLRATLAGVGFMPSLAWRGTDLPSLRPDVRTVIDPYSGEELTAFPAIACDLAVMHALEADREGNARIGRNWGADRELALVADRVIITADKISPSLKQADIIAPLVDAVVETPRGAWPTSCHPLYPMDGLAILQYAEKAGTAEEAALQRQWLEKHGLAFT
jgi:glutaconate CoA-transferase subunit A